MGKGKGWGKAAGARAPKMQGVSRARASKPRQEGKVEGVGCKVNTRQAGKARGKGARGRQVR